MGAVTARAEQIAATLKAGGLNATTKLRNFKVPGVLVVPVPKYQFNLLGGEASVTWTLVAIAKGPGDEDAAASLEEMVLTCAGLLDIESADPGTYKLPVASDPLPAYTLTTTDDIAPTEEQS